MALGIVRFLLLVGLIKLLVETEKPVLCAGIYAGINLLFGLLGGPPVVALVTAVVQFVLALVYFWLLDRIDTGSFPWFVVLIAGILIGFV